MTFALTGQGDGACPAGSSVVTYVEVTRYLDAIKSSGVIPQWSIVRIRGGGSITGSGYNYEYM